MAREGVWCHKCQKYHSAGSGVSKKHKSQLGLSTGTSLHRLSHGLIAKKKK